MPTAGLLLHREYNDTLKAIKSEAPQSFHNYLLKNWDTCKEKWVLYLTQEATNFSTYTTNFLESSHQKLKTFLKPQMSLAVCLGVETVILLILGFNISLPPGQEILMSPHGYKTKPPTNQVLDTCI